MANVLEVRGLNKSFDGIVVARDIDLTLQSGRVVEFRDEQIEKLQEIIADQLGYELVGHRLELYAVPRRGRSRPDEV